MINNVELYLKEIWGYAVEFATPSSENVSLAGPC
jgi:hypothetical protein